MIAFKAGGDNDSGGRNLTTSNGLRVIDAEGIDAPRLPEAERQRRQENIRRTYQRVNSSRFRHSSSIEEPVPDKSRNVLQRKLSSRVSFSEDVLKAAHRDEELNEENTGEVQKATDELAVANRQEESDDSIVETNNVAVESTTDIESGQEKEVIKKEIDSL
jgi:hypothetical protein